MFRTSTCGLVPAVGEHGEQAANTHTGLDGFEAAVDLRVGGPCRDGDVRRRALDRPRLARSAAATRRGRWPGQQCCDLSQQRGSRRAGQPHVRFGWSRRPSGTPAVPVASRSRPARQRARDQTTRRSANVRCADGRRAATDRHCSSSKRSSRRRELTGCLDGIHTGAVAACTTSAAPAPRSFAAAAPARIRSRAPDTCSPAGSICSSARGPRSSVGRTAAAGGRGRAPERHRLVG
jgi:hypothetical protein